MNKELLEKYFDNRCSQEELDSIIVWFKESARTAEGKSLLFKFWEEVSDEDSNHKINYNQLLGRIHHEINLTQTKNILDEADQDIIRYRRRKQFMQILTRAAAILMFPVLGFSIYMSARYQSVKDDQITVNQAYNEVFSSVDAITKVSLPDGSNVWLNHSSLLKYPAKFIGESRTVELKGEGYFEVKHNPSKPFIVKAGTIDIIALGTTFNVMAYPDEDRVETYLIEGSVELQKEGPYGKPISLVIMKPTDMTVFQKINGELAVRTISDDRYFSWKEGKLVFNKEPMEEVAKKLSRWFNVDIQINDPRLQELTYNGTFVDETLLQVMELMAMISPLSYTISDRKAISSGTFSKRKVIIKYKDT